MNFKGLRVHRPESLAAVADLQRRFGDDAALLAGGTELLLLMRLGLTRFDHLISLRRLPGMADLSVSPSGDLILGGGVTHQQVADSPIVRQLNGVLAQAEGRLANLRVRASGTLAGNLAFADPHSDTLTLLSALGAWIESDGAGEHRRVPVTDLVTGLFTTVLEPGEIVTRIVIPARWLNASLAHERFESRRQRPMVTVSCAGHTDSSGRLDDVRLVVGSVCPHPLIVDTLAELLVGARPEEVEPATVVEAGTSAAGEIPVRDDEDGAADYKSNLVSVLVRRAVRDMLSSSATPRKDARMP
jgi:carbon-monoxide dehydrogenase medium subunit